MGTPLAVVPSVGLDYCPVTRIHHSRCDFNTVFESK